MKNNKFLSGFVKNFLLDYAVNVRNLSRNTQQSYRDTLRLLILFFSKKIKKSVDQLTVEDISAEKIKIFLLGLKSSRKCSLATRNQRLAAIHAFALFVGTNNPEYTEWCRQIRIIPFKKAQKPLITYLEKLEMDALLDSPNRKDFLGNRDYIILLFLYNTGARVDEVAQLKISDINIENISRKNFAFVTIKGKGNKLRRCPLWDKTVQELLKLVANRDKSEHVFLNRCNQPITRFGIYALVKRYIKKITPLIPSLEKKSISPHTIRHTTATHLLRAGVDINTIRAWLGHVSINTTNIYAEVDLEMKAKALACCEIVNEKNKKQHWRDNKGLMEFLDSL